MKLLLRIITHKKDLKMRLIDLDGLYTPAIGGDNIAGEGFIEGMTLGGKNSNII